jgi:hypothetical protein
VAKYSLVELFDLPIEEIRHAAMEKTGTGYLRWQIERCKDRIVEILEDPDWRNQEKSAMLNYIIASKEHFEGNYNELTRGENTNLRKTRMERQESVQSDGILSTDAVPGGEKLREPKLVSEGYAQGCP